MSTISEYRGKVLVAGATGKTGSWVVRRLLHYGVPVRVLSRSEEKARTLFGDKVEIVVGKIQSDEDVARAVEGCTGVISALGSSSVTGESSPSEVDRDGAIRLVDAAAKAGVTHMAMVSSIAVTKWFHPLNLFGGVLTMKYAAEEHLRKVFSQPGRSCTIIRPGGLRDGEPLQHRLQVDQGDRLWSGWTNRSDVAELAVISLWVPKAKNRTFEVISEAPEAQQSLEKYYEQLHE
ncbi:MAG: SDR family oxidoreductase [Chlorobiaceae bacterium]|nr:SDR family oxidoreductase [Chlorobiales bacterium]NTU90894.1 SDR family oxidoreductase [Chlorobiaceae bacterium]NTV24920.1 SDR family oxidoreductase [Chlorobiaceae bacterium]